jgi:integrase
MQKCSAFLSNWELQMARTKCGTPPSYRRHSSGQACVTVRDPTGCRREILLGKWQSPESKAEYARILAELATDQGRMPVRAGGPAQATMTVNELILAFWRYAEQHYRRPDGTPTGELDNMRDALRPLKALYGHTPAQDFDSASLETMQEEMIRSGRLCRTTINARVNRVRRLFRWGVRKRHIPVQVIQSIATVPGLQCGRTGAAEPEGVLPVPAEHVDAALPGMPAPVRAMVELQRLSGMRVGEVMAMRAIDLTMTGPVWTYRPASHKNNYRGLERIVYLGPQAQEIVKQFLTNKLDAFLFNPRAYVEELRRRRAERRRSKRTHSELKRRRKVKPRRVPAERYNRRSYRVAVVRACRKAGVPEWSPLQIRHTAATTIRAMYGVEAAKVILGHTKVETAQIYAERDMARAQQIMREIG